MSLSKTSPEIFTGTVIEKTAHFIRVLNEDHGYEAMVKLKNIRANSIRPCSVGSTGLITVSSADGVVFTPDIVG